MVRRTVVPSSTIASIVSHRAMRLRGSSPVVGSSRKITGGSATSAAARSRRLPHAARVGLHKPVARLVELEAVEQSARPLGRALLAEVIEAPDHLEVLEAGQVLVDRGVLPRQADLRAQRRGVVLDVEPHHAGLAGGGREERRQDAHRGRLAGAVRAKQAEHRPALDAQVDSAERLHVLVRLGEAVGLDCEFFRHERFNLATPARRV